MRVSELIEKLKEVDQDAIIYTIDQEYGDLYELEDIGEELDIHIQNYDISECSGEDCYCCERNSESPQNYKKVKGLRID